MLRYVNVMTPGSCKVTWTLNEQEVPAAKSRRFVPCSLKSPQLSVSLRCSALVLVRPIASPCIESCNHRLSGRHGSKSEKKSVRLVVARLCGCTASVYRVGTIRTWIRKTGNSIQISGRPEEAHSSHATSNQCQTQNADLYRIFPLPFHPTSQF